MEGIIFSSHPEELKKGDVFYANIQKDISSKDELLKAYSEALNFPSWFGNNWDALEDLLADLSWIDHAKVIVHHEDLPSLNSKDLNIFLDIIKLHSFSHSTLDPSEFFKVHGKKLKNSVQFVFPESCKSDINKILLG